MSGQITLSTVCAPARGVVSREVEGEVAILPPIVGIGDGAEDLFTLNGTGCTVWRGLDGKATLADVAVVLARDFAVSLDQAEADVLDFARALTERGILDVSA